MANLYIGQFRDILKMYYEKQKGFNPEDMELQQIINDNMALFRKWMIHFKRILSQKLLAN